MIYILSLLEAIQYKERKASNLLTFQLIRFALMFCVSLFFADLSALTQEQGRVRNAPNINFDKWTPPRYVFQDSIRFTIRAHFPVDRTQYGTLWVEDEAGFILMGPVPALGRSATNIAGSSNPSRNPIQRNGDTPTGDYEAIPVMSDQLNSAGVPFNEVLSSSGKLSYGNEGMLFLKPVSGQAYQAKQAGRGSIMIHAGDPANNGGLRPTAGCIRLFAQDMAALFALVASNEYGTQLVAENISSIVTTGLPAPGETTDDVISDPIPMVEERIEEVRRFTNTILDYHRYLNDVIGEVISDPTRKQIIEENERLQDWLDYRDHHYYLDYLAGMANSMLDDYIRAGQAGMGAVPNSIAVEYEPLNYARNTSTGTRNSSNRDNGVYSVDLGGRAFVDYGEQYGPAGVDNPPPGGRNSTIRPCCIYE